MTGPWLALLLQTAAPATPPPAWAAFGAPREVAIQGYRGDAMEPFLSRDGRLLFFNNRNDPPGRTDLHWAERIDDLHFRYRGPVAGANGPALDAVASLSAAGRFCFVSTRAYAGTLATVYCGRWRHGRLDQVTLQRQAAPLVPGRLVFDLELDASGATMIVADGRFAGGAVPETADLRLARWRDGAYRLDPAADPLFAAVNTPALEYAAALSADGRLLAFTRLAGGAPSLWLARRDRPDAAFGPPVRLDALTGFVEAATFAPGGRAFYYHRLTEHGFTIWRATR
jgi:hypothetical protein